ncbi:TPA: YfhO family protein [Streptococcus suis]
MQYIKEKAWDFYRSKKGLYVLSALIPLVVMMIVWAMMGVFPFGNSTLMSIDFGQQYISLYQFFKETILSGDWSGLFYSFSKSIGGAMIGIWGFNLLSPFNLIYVITPTEHFRWAITITIWLRYAATALAFAFLLIRRYQGHTNGRRFLVPVLSAAYAMSGMIVAYQMNPIFYDAMIMLPIVIVYLEELMDGGPGWKYALTLSLTLVFHFYMGYMICLFIAMYVFYYMAGKGQSWRQAWYPIARAFAYSVFGAGAVMFLLFPIFLNLLISKGAYESTLTFEWAMQINPLDILSKLMVGAFDSQSWPAGPNLPNLFVGSLALFGSGIFFAKSEIKLGQKIAAAGILLMFFIAIVNVFFNKVWHMGQTPAGFFYRFSWIASFFMVLLAYRALHNWSKKSWGLLLIGLGFIYLAGEWTFSKEFSFFNLDPASEALIFMQDYLATTLRIITVAVTLLFIKLLEKKGRKMQIGLAIGGLTVFVLITVLDHFSLLIKLQTLSLALWVIVLIVLTFGFKRVTYLMISALTLFELGANALIAQSRMNYDNAAQFQDAQISVKVPIDQIRPSQNGEFYRINKLFERSKNDPFMYDYPGLTHFSSNMERDTLSFMTNVGDSGSNASSHYANGTPWMDAFYGVRYVVDYQPYTNEDTQANPDRRYFYHNTTRTDLLERYSQIWSNDRYMIYENPNVLPPAFGVSKAVIDLTLDPNQLVKTHNEMLSALAGQELTVFQSYLFEETEMTNVQLVESENGNKLYKKIDPNQDGVLIFRFTPQTNATYYINAPLALKRQKGGKTEIQLNNRWYEYQHSFDGQQLWNVAHNQQGQTVELKLTMKETSELDLTNLYMITADNSPVDQIIADRMAQGMQVTEWGNNFMKGTVNITDNSTFMMTSIPFNLGWTVKVDGQVVDLYEAWGAFMAFPISPGQHEIEMVFIPDGWYLGLGISAFSIIMIVVFTFVEKRRGVTA